MQSQFKLSLWDLLKPRKQGLKMRLTAFFTYFSTLIGWLNSIWVSPTPISNEPERDYGHQMG
jgi:hypothetical protein